MENTWDIKITSNRCPFCEQLRSGDFVCYSLGRKEVQMLCQEYNCPLKVRTITLI